MTYDHCLQDRNETLLRLFNVSDVDQITSPLASNGLSLSAVLRELPVCDLQKELDNVSRRYSCWHSSTVDLSNLRIANDRVRWPTDCLGYGISVHHLHRGRQSVSSGAPLVGAVLLDALSLGYWFAVRHARRRRHFDHRHETLSECPQRNTGWWVASLAFSTLHTQANWEHCDYQRARRCLCSAEWIEWPNQSRTGLNFTSRKAYASLLYSQPMAPRGNDCLWFLPVTFVVVS